MAEKRQPAQWYKTIFLSDFHIGAKAFNAPALLDFLRKTESETLYLVGDIIDGWKLRKRWYWPESTSQIFDELFRKAHNGTKIIYITGNHDEAVRDISVLKRLRYARRFNILIKNKMIHTLEDGRDILVLHGDQFDRAILRGRLSRWSDRLYDIALNHILRSKGPTINVDGVEKRFSLSKFLAYHGQIALNILNNFENAVVREARRADVHGIICGHTHIPALKTIKHTLYGNCGCWLKDMQSALVETAEGKLELIHWDFCDDGRDVDPILPFVVKDLERFCSPSTHQAYRPKTLQIMLSIRRIWPSPHKAVSDMHNPKPEISDATKENSALAA